MEPPVALDRAKMIIQGWYDDYCKAYEKTLTALDIQVDDRKGSRAYRVANPKNGTATVIFWSAISDFESFQGTGIPSDLIGNIWDAFNDLG